MNTSVGKLVNVITGKEDANFSTPNGSYKFFTCSSETALCDLPTFEGNAILISGNGEFNVKHYSGKFNAYQRTYVLIPANPQLYAAIYFASSSHIDNLKRHSTGSIVKFITKGDVENIPVYIPDNSNILNEMNRLIITIEHNQEQNDSLVVMRDWLLPMLMNGQATIKD